MSTPLGHEGNITKPWGISHYKQGHVQLACNASQQVQVSGIFMMLGTQRRAHSDVLYGQRLRMVSQNGLLWNWCLKGKWEFVRPKPKKVALQGILVRAGIGTNVQSHASLWNPEGLHSNLFHMWLFYMKLFCECWSCFVFSDPHPGLCGHACVHTHTPIHPGTRGRRLTGMVRKVGNLCYCLFLHYTQQTVLLFFESLVIKWMFWYQAFISVEPYGYISEGIW